MIEVTGTKEVQANIEKVMNIVSKDITEGLEEIGERGVGYLKRETPVDSGRLRKSMSYTIDNKVHEPLGNVTMNDKLNKQRAKDEVDIGTNVVYAPSVEYLANNGSQGYFYRAWKKTKQSADQILAKVIRSDIR